MQPAGFTPMIQTHTAGRVTSPEGKHSLPLGREKNHKTPPARLNPLLHSPGLLTEDTFSTNKPDRVSTDKDYKTQVRDKSS